VEKDAKKLREKINKMLNSLDVMHIDFVAIDKAKNEIKTIKNFDEYQVWDYINEE
jgi:predicted aldo/keto reductase-like oxidoreductase